MLIELIARLLAGGQKPKEENPFEWSPGVQESQEPVQYTQEEAQRLWWVAGAFARALERDINAKHPGTITPIDVASGDRTEGGPDGTSGFDGGFGGPQFGGW